MYRHTWFVEKSFCPVGAGTEFHYTGYRLLSGTVLHLLKQVRHLENSMSIGTSCVNFTETSTVQTSVSVVCMWGPGDITDKAAKSLNLQCSVCLLSGDWYSKSRWKWLASFDTSVSQSSQTISRYNTKSRAERTVKGAPVNTAVILAWYSMFIPV